MANINLLVATRTGHTWCVNSWCPIDKSDKILKVGCNFFHTLVIATGGDSHDLNPPDFERVPLDPIPSHPVHSSLYSTYHFDSHVFIFTCLHLYFHFSSRTSSFIFGYILIVADKPHIVIVVHRYLPNGHIIKFFYCSRNPIITIILKAWGICFIRLQTLEKVNLSLIRKIYVATMRASESGTKIISRLSLINSCIISLLYLLKLLVTYLCLLLSLLKWLIKNWMLITILRFFCAGREVFQCVYLYGVL